MANTYLLACRKKIKKKKDRKKRKRTMTKKEKAPQGMKKALPHILLEVEIETKDNWTLAVVIRIIMDPGHIFHFLNPIL